MTTYFMVFNIFMALVNRRTGQKGDLTV